MNLGYTGSMAESNEPKKTHSLYERGRHYEREPYDKDRITILGPSTMDVMIEQGGKLEMDEDGYVSFRLPETALYRRSEIVRKNRVRQYLDCLDQEIAEALIAHPPKFIGLSAKYEFDIALEKLLLEHGIVSYENLVHADTLPATFMFYGLPLKIMESDGSPVRAVGVV